MWRDSSTMPNWRDLVLPTESLYVNPDCRSVYSDWSDGSDITSCAEFEPFSDEVAECNGLSCASCGGSSPGSDNMDQINWSMFEPARKRTPSHVLATELWLLRWGLYLFILFYFNIVNAFRTRLFYQTFLKPIVDFCWNVCYKF